MQTEDLYIYIGRYFSVSIATTKQAYNGDLNADHKRVKAWGVLKKTGLCNVSSYIAFRFTGTFRGNRELYLLPYSL